jgi:hypothetical protein
MSSFYYFQRRAHERIQELHREAATASAAERAVSKDQPDPVCASLRACVRTALTILGLLPAVRGKAIISAVLVIGAGGRCWSRGNPLLRLLRPPHSLPHVTASTSRTGRPSEATISVDPVERAETAFLRFPQRERQGLDLVGPFGRS